jgi:hypothetical protein
MLKSIAFEQIINNLFSSIGDVLKQRLIEGIKEKVQPEVDKIIEETAEGILNDIRVKIIGYSDFGSDNFVTKLVINDKEKEIK